MRFVPAPFRSGSTWWWSFGLLIAAPALVLALLGLWAARADLREQQTRVASLADDAITNAIARLEAELRRAEIGAQGSIEPVPTLSDLPIFSFHQRGLLTFHRERVYFDESGGHATLKTASAEWPFAIEQLIEAAQAAEAQQRPREALTMYRRIASAESRLRAWAEFGVARIEYQGGDAAALARLASSDWNRFDGRTPAGLPIALIACSYIEGLPDTKRTFSFRCLSRRSRTCEPDGGG